MPNRQALELKSKNPEAHPKKGAEKWPKKWGALLRHSQYRGHRTARVEKRGAIFRSHFLIPSLYVVRFLGPKNGPHFFDPRGPVAPIL